MRKYLSAILLAGSLLSMPVASWAATVTLTATDALGETSWNTGLHWSDATAPTNGNDYVVPLQWLRTPTVAGGTNVFAGDSLTVTGAGGLIIKSDDTTYVIDDLILEDGGIIWGGNTGGNAGTVFDGNITVVDPTGINSPTIHANQSSYTVNSYITGSGDLTLAGGSSITMNGTIDMTGDVIISAGTKFFSTNSVSIFKIGADGVNNAITGTGVTFDGTFTFDLTGASTTLGDSWTLTTAGAAFGTNFVVSGFLDNGDGSWYRDNGSGKYKYYESSGVLTAVSANVIPITAQDLIPQKVILQTQPEISITLIDGSDNEVVTASIAMTVNGGGVTPGVTSPGNGTHTVSYTPGSPLAVGPVNVQVTYDDDSAISYTNSWSFSIHPTTTETLWNINIAGNATGVQRPVADGVFAVAPAAGANLWNNVAGANGSDNTFFVLDANGANQITYETSGSHNWGESTANGMTVEMFQGWTGANAPMNMTNVLSGLDSANAYDIYIYSTWRWTQNTVNYEIIEGFADVTLGSITEVQANVQNDATNDYSGCIEGENYIILHSVTPTASGRIAFTGVCPDGVLSGMQILEIPGGGGLPDLTVGGSSPADGATAVSSTPTLEAYFTDVAGTVNSGSISMTIDGNSVSPSFSYSDPVSTVSYTVATPLELATAHTVQVVVAGSPSGILYTNEWSFFTAGSRVYVDAVAGPGSNTTEWNGSQWVEFSPPQNIAGGGDNMWEEEWGAPPNLFGNLPSTSNSWFEAGREGAEDAPQLRTRATGLVDGTYQVFAYFWWADGAGQDFFLGTALTNNPAGGLPLYSVNVDNVPSAGVASADASQFTSSVLVTSADRILYEISLGTVEVSGGVLEVYIDDVGDNSNVWYDGIGYQEGSGATLPPDIHSISVAGGIVTLQWDSQSGATYSILQKDSLTGAWTPAKTGIAGGDPTTSDSVPVSGADQEFFQIEGN